MNQTLILCTRDGQPWVEVGLTDRHASPTFRNSLIYSEFLNDCGFQCTAWLVAAVMHQEYDKPFVPFDSNTAVTWRNLYEHHLHISGEGGKQVVPSDIHFGGAGNLDMKGQLQDLLQAHGVPASLSSQRADSVLEKIGRQQTLYALRSKQPWRDLKALANQVVPKLQLVLASELSQVIEDRLATDRPFGERKKKKAIQPRPRIELSPEDIAIPDGIFKEGDSHPLTQIGLEQVGPAARGVIVVKSQQAAPYLKIHRPVSSGGLALLVLDHQALSLHGLGETIRFPARCNVTGEPVLLTAKLVQIGSTVVTRLSAEGKPKVDEVSNQVVKAAIYRDELKCDWEKVRERPVKWIVSEFPELATQNKHEPVILDCWDRQFLTLKLERSRPETASVFVATFRLAMDDTQSLIAKSGHGPTYFEPRSHDGKSHADTHRVIWLNKHDKESAVLAKQSTERWTSLVRAGDRYGLRVMKIDAEFVHKQHKPSIPFLDGTQLDIYTAGPFPYGATRQSLAKLFSVWNWPARPLQPKGRTADQSGMIWEIQAAAPPEFEVYQVEHADILISAAPKRTKQGAMDKVDIQGSAKTIAALTRQKQLAGDNVDPWEANKGSDPWGNWQPTSKAARKWEAPTNPDIVASQIEAKVIKAIEAKLPTVAQPADVALSSAEDARIQNMEERMTKLEATVHSNHAKHEQQHIEVKSSVQSLQHQVSSQGQELQKHFDQRMQEQLGQIELLIARHATRE